MPQHVRLYYRDPMNGRVPSNLNWPAVTSNSVVHITACEYVPERSDPHGGFGGTDRKRFIGAADIWVSNIAPHGSPWDPNQGVSWVLHIGWETPIYVCVDITVFDEGPGEIQT